MYESVGLQSSSMSLLTLGEFVCFASLSRAGFRDKCTKCLFLTLGRTFLFNVTVKILSGFYKVGRVVPI